MITRGYIVLWFMWTCYLGRSTMATLFCNSCASATLTLNIFPLQDDSWNQNHPPKLRHAQRQAWERSVSSSIAGLRGKNSSSDIRHLTYCIIKINLHLQGNQNAINRANLYTRKRGFGWRWGLAQTVLSDVDGWIAAPPGMYEILQKIYCAKQLS